MVAAAAGLALLFPIGLALGLIVLGQQPSAVQLGSIALVVVAGAAAQRGGRRMSTTDIPQDHVLLPLNTAEPT